MGMNLREAEARQMERIENLDLTRYVDHQYFDTPMEHSPEGPLVKALTIVLLKDGEDVIASGEAFCSAKEQFHKRKGRVIATARALEKIRNEEE